MFSQPWWKDSDTEGTTFAEIAVKHSRHKTSDNREGIGGSVRSRPLTNGTYCLLGRSPNIVCAALGPLHTSPFQQTHCLHAPSEKLWCGVVSSWSRLYSDWRQRLYVCLCVFPTLDGYCVVSQKVSQNQSNNNQQTYKTATSAPATLCNVSEPHLHFQRRFRPTSFQVGEDLRRLT